MRALIPLLLALPAQAQEVLFSDDFNTELPAFNATPAQWIGLKGTVDIVGPGLAAGLCSDGSTCIDMDGSTQSGGQMRTTTFFPLAPGARYTLSFDYSNNGGENTLLYGIGDTSEVLSVTGPERPYKTVTLTVVGQGTEEAIFFADTGADNGGVVIDNVRLVAAP
jgi:hypothetical protein